MMHTDVYEMIAVVALWIIHFFWRRMGVIQGRVVNGIGGRRVITNTSRAWLSISLPLSFSVFSKLGSAPNLVSEARGLFSGRGYSSSMIVFVCAAGGKERAALVSKSSALQGLYKASTLLLVLLHLSLP